MGNPGYANGNPRLKTPIPKVEDYGDEYAKQPCVKCGRLFVINAVGHRRSYCYSCHPPADPYLFHFRPVRVADLVPKRPRTPRDKTGGLRKDAMKLHICHCGSKMVPTSIRIIEAGKNKSCGLKNCKEDP